MRKLKDLIKRVHDSIIIIGIAILGFLLWIVINLLGDEEKEGMNCVSQDE